MAVKIVVEYAEADWQDPAQREARISRVKSGIRQAFKERVGEENLKAAAGYMTAAVGVLVMAAVVHAL